MSSERVELALERLSEDSSLTGELDDQTASVLLQWAEQQVQAADEIGDDAAFGERVMAVRSAAKAAARPTTRSGEIDPADVIVRRATELLNASLQQAAPRTTASDASSPATTASAPEPVNERAAPTEAAALLSLHPLAAPSPAAPRSAWQTLRRRIRRWTHRKA